MLVIKLVLIRKKGENMSKKKKNKVTRLSEEAYNQYIMSLKEERPVKVIVPKDEKAGK